MATIDQADIRGSKPHNHDPSGAASDYYRESGRGLSQMSAEGSPSCLLRLRLTLSSSWIALFKVLAFSLVGSCFCFCLLMQQWVVDKLAQP